MPHLLSNVRILDLSRMLAGPYGSMLLGDLGAEVIKIEEPAGDFTRTPAQYHMGGSGLTSWPSTATKNPWSLT